MKCYSQNLAKIWGGFEKKKTIEFIWKQQKNHKLNFQIKVVGLFP